MKILVDCMPDKPYSCIYCKDESTMDFTSYVCKWNNSNHNCWNTQECPYFIAEMKGENNYDSRRNKRKN